MFPYVVFTIIYLLCIALANSVYKKNKRLGKVLMIVNIILLSLFAAFRGYSVGADVKTYGLRMFNSERGRDFLDHLGNYSTFEFGYYLINNIVAKITDNFHIFLFIHQIILSTTITFIAIRENNTKNGSYSLIMIAYYILWYFTSFNILRQSISLIILLFSYNLLEQKNYKKYITRVIIATFFHQSSIIYLFAPILHKIATGKNKTIKTTMLYIATIISLITVSIIGSALISKIPIISKYANYLNKTDVNLNIYYLLYKIFFATVVGVFYLRLNKDSKNKNSGLFCFMVFDVIFYGLSGLIKFGYRLSYFFLMHNILFIPRIDKCIMGKNEKRSFRFTVAALFISYWIIRFVLCKYDKILPYVF